jgi:predicted nucleic acid-binding protein
MILDSDILIAIERELTEALAWMDSAPEPLAVAGPAALELVAGCRNQNELRHIQELLAEFPILWPSQEAQQRALTTLMPLRLAHGIGPLDVLIAATALEADETLVTFNIRHFRAVPGLVVHVPYTQP